MQRYSDFINGTTIEMDAGCFPACSMRPASRPLRICYEKRHPVLHRQRRHHALRMIIERPDLRLVGLHAHGADKIGRDAPNCAGYPNPLESWPPTTSMRYWSSRPTVWSTPRRPRCAHRKAIEEISRFLRAGTNVVGTSMVWLVAPYQADEWMRAPLAKACEAGGASLYINGVDPASPGTAWCTPH